MNEYVLFVDDEQNILDSFRRTLRKKLAFDCVNSGQAALEAIAEKEYAVIVADQMMPGMNGIQLLAEVKKRSPNTVRMMLTGQADISIAMNAVNEGHIFRFLTKPCPPAVLFNAVKAAIEQYGLITAEKELLGKTLRGSVKVLTEILSLVSPVASGKTTRIQRYVRELTSAMKLEDEWKYDLAAMLSQVGCITLPPEIVDKYYSGERLTEAECELFGQHPKVAKKMIANIPRLEAVAYMISGQLRKHSEFPDKTRTTPFVVGAQLLKVAIDFDSLIYQGLHQSEAIHFMERKADTYNPDILQALKTIHVEKTNTRLRMVKITELHTHMVFDQNVTAANGLVLVRKGKEVTFTVIELLKSFAEGIGVKQPIRVIESL